ncbi:MAG: hypothetical protein IKX30_13000 [Victivallales bacterium]|nr:hypothetical protein [Victivallales bacterium]
MTKKLLNLMTAIFVTCSMGAFAALTLEFDPVDATVVKGYSSTTTPSTAIYVTSTGENVTQLIMKIALGDGVTMADGVTAGTTASVTLNKDLFYLTSGGEIDKSQTVVKTSVTDNVLTISLSIAVAGNVPSILKLKSGVKAKLCDVAFAVDIDATDETAEATSVFGQVTACKVDKVNYSDYNDEGLTFIFYLLRNSYSFVTNDGAEVTLNEDDAAVAIDATDTALFTAKVWDIAAEAMVATDAVEFVYADPIDSAAGTLDFVDGKIVYTPAPDYNGSFTLNYIADFTELSNSESSAIVTGSVNVVVNAVNDAPAIAIVTDPLNVNEGEALTFEMTFEDPDTAWDAFTKTVTLDGAVIAGEWTAGKVETTRTAPVYTFTATEPVGFDAVAHPAKDKTAALVVTIDDNIDDEGSIGTANADVTINDVDQATDFGASAIAASATPDPAVYGSKLTAVFTDDITDDDGDTAEITYQWYRDSVAVAGETALELKTAVKKGEAWQIKAVATVKPYGDEVAAEQEFASNVIEIGNTAPTTADAALFIRKMDGGDGVGTAEITMADVDEDELTIVIKTQGTKGTAEVDGNTIKYTVTDKAAEFFDNDADTVVFVVNDGTDDSAEATLTVTYRENPPAEVAITTAAPETIDEVDDKGEAVSFTIAIAATDSEEVTPAGITAIEWTADEGLTIDSTTTEGLDTLAATSTIVVKTNGYATLDGADRPANKEFTVTANVTDALGAVTTQKFTVTVNDVDRLAPADFTLTFDPESPKTEDNLTAVVNGTPVDPDGDVITGYKFAWTVDGAAIDDVTGETLDNSYFKKGQTIAVKAIALTTPYGGDAVENEASAEAISAEIVNTVPTIAKIKGAVLEATEDQAAGVYALADFVTITDPDLTDGVDTLTYTVTPNFDATVGTFSFDAEALTVTFTPAENYNTAALETLPTFSVAVSDGTETTEAVAVEISVASVNDIPTAEDVALFIRKLEGGDGTGSVEVPMSDVEGDALTIVIKKQGAKGTAEVVGNAIQYTVTDLTTEFFDDAADVVTFVVNDGTDDSEEHTLTVTYRENPPAEIAITTAAPEAIDEVDDKGDAVSFTVAISATDSEEVTPAGITKIEWTADEGLTIDTIETDGLDTLAATSSAVIKTNGYTTLDGADRPANQEFTVTATVTDALGATTTETFTVTVNDVDRLAPADFTIAFDPAEPKAEDDLTAVVNGTPADPDGDDIIGYKFVWTVNGAEVAEDGDVLAAANFKKGDTIAVKAAALTKPYAAEDVENDYMEEAASIAIANTVPALAKVEGAKLEATEDQGAVDFALNDFVTVIDPDAVDGVDTLAYTVTPNFGEEVGTLTYDAESGNVTFTPAEDYNTEGLEALPTFSVTVSDGEVTTDAVEVEISVAAVNDAPKATVQDVYIQPSQVGTTVTASFAIAAGPEDETAQQLALAAWAYTGSVDGKALMGGDPTAEVDNEAKTIIFNFPIDENAENGATGTVSFTLQDDGDPAQTAEFTFKVIVSGTPWYPAFVLNCDDDVEGLMVRITSDGEQTDVVVKEKNDEGKFVLTPATYYNSGFKGFERGVTGDVTVYHWTAKGGAGEECSAEQDGIVVPDYAAPGQPTIEGTVDANAITVTAPLASGFVLTVYDADGNVVTTVAQEFGPAADGELMESTALVTLTGLESGKTYKAVAQGVNPMGEYSENSEEFVIDLTDSPATEWPGDGEFYPAQNWTTTIATNAMDVTFKWPVDAKSDSYTLKVFDGDGNAVKTVNGIAVNMAVVNLPAGNYRWLVETSNGGVSELMLFTIIKNAGNNAVITGGMGAGNTLLLDAENLTPGATYKYDVIYFDTKYNQWAYQLFTGRADADGTLLELTGDDVSLYEGPNYIMIRPTAQGSYQTLLINESRN